MSVGAADRDLLDLVDRFFGDHADPGPEDAPWAPGAWDQLMATGLPLVGLDEDGGGSGGTLVEVVAVVAGAARHGVAMPLVENWLGAWLCLTSEREPSAGAATVAAPASMALVGDAAVRGRVVDVPWLGQAVDLQALVPSGDGWSLASVATADLVVEGGTDLAGEPRGSAALDDVAASVLPSSATPAGFAQRAALLRAAQLAGALQGVHDLTWRYTHEREQFGKPVAAFQAVQEHLVVTAQCAAMSMSAVEGAALALERGAADFEVAAAKLVVSENASRSARAAHQAHGAIGMTREYPLQRLTRRLFQWREQDGGVRQLSAAVGQAAAAAPSLAALVASSPAKTEVTW